MKQRREPPRDLAAQVQPWVDHLLAQGYSPATTRMYGAIVRRGLDDLPARPERADVEVYLSGRRRHGLSVGAARNAAFALRSFLTFVRPANRPLQLMAPKAPRSVRLPPPPGDVGRLIVEAQAEPRDAALLAILVDTGARVSEVALLARGAVIPTDCGGRALYLQGKAAPRSGPRPRIVPLSPEAAQVVHRWLLVAAARRPLFPSADAIRHRLRRLSARAGIANVTPHQLRHFYTTQALASGAPLKAVSEMLGHASAATTLDVYTHLSAPDLEEAQAEFSPFVHLNPTVFPQPLQAHRSFKGRSLSTKSTPSIVRKERTVVPWNTRKRS